MVFINNLPEPLTSLVRLFADDIAVYRVAAYTIDQDQPHKDQPHKDIKLELRENSWDMVFHPANALASRSQGRKKTLDGKYYLHNQTLATATWSKYLEITIYQDLS